jgi:GTP cyclohydrolase I
MRNVSEDTRLSEKIHIGYLPDTNVATISRMDRLGSEEAAADYSGSSYLQFRILRVFENLLWIKF